MSGHFPLIALEKQVGHRCHISHDNGRETTPTENFFLHDFRNRILGPCYWGMKNRSSSCLNTRSPVFCKNNSRTWGNGISQPSIKDVCNELSKDPYTSTFEPFYSCQLTSEVFKNDSHNKSKELKLALETLVLLPSCKPSEGEVSTWWYNTYKSVVNVSGGGKLWSLWVAMAEMDTILHPPSCSHSFAVNWGLKLKHQIITMCSNSNR